MVLHFEAARGFTVADVGKSLSRERTRQGLSLKDVRTRTGIPEDQLRAAETGALDRPDGLATLKTVRRYADFLGLPGDRFALAVLERWPTKGGVPHPFAPTASQPAPGSAAVTGDTAAPRRQPDHHPHRGTNGDGRAVHAGEPTAVGDVLASVSAIGWGIHGGGFDAPFHGAYSVTGVTPAVVAPAEFVRRRTHAGVPVLLQGLVIVIVLAVLAGVALLALNQVKPSWLRAVGLSHAAGPSSAPSAGQNGASTVAHSAATTSVLRPTTTSGAAVFRVRATKFSAKLSSTLGPCWVQVTTDTSSRPAYAGVIKAGESRTFSGLHSLVVVIGSTSGRLSLTSAGGRVATYAPSGAPYRITVHTRR